MKGKRYTTDAKIRILQEADGVMSINLSINSPLD